MEPGERAMEDDHGQQQDSNILTKFKQGWEKEQL
jgi:hypothetical protein